MSPARICPDCGARVAECAGPGPALEPALGSRAAPERGCGGRARRAESDGESRGDRRGHRVALGRGGTSGSTGWRTGRGSDRPGADRLGCCGGLTRFGGSRAIPDQPRAGPGRAGAGFRVAPDRPAGGRVGLSAPVGLEPARSQPRREHRSDRDQGLLGGFRGRGRGAVGWVKPTRIRVQQLVGCTHPPLPN
jgi:hypothetical protein